MSYQTGHIKRNVDTGEVATRTSFADDNTISAGIAWLIATPNLGARNARTSEVESWDDVYVPESESGS